MTATTWTCPDEGELTEWALEGASAGPLSEHLAGCPNCRRRLDELRAALTGLGLLTEVAALSPPSPKGVPNPPEDPGVVSLYLVLGLLRREPGMSVYRGVHSVIRSHEVAIFLADRPQADDPTTLVALRSALSPLNRLDHPAILRSIDFGLFQGRPYLLIEHVEGRPLARILEDRTFTRTEAAAIGAELARALASAHRAGLVHGALSIASISLDERGHPRIVDFGGSWLMESAGARPEPTVDLAALATIVSHMAPELAEVCASTTSSDGDVLARALERAGRSRRLPAWPTDAIAHGLSRFLRWRS